MAVRSRFSCSLLGHSHVTGQFNPDIFVRSFLRHMRPGSRGGEISLSARSMEIRNERRTCYDSHDRSFDFVSPSSLELFPRSYAPKIESGSRATGNSFRGDECVLGLDLPSADVERRMSNKRDLKRASTFYTTNLIGKHTERGATLTNERWQLLSGISHIV